MAEISKYQRRESCINTFTKDVADILKRLDIVPLISKTPSYGTKIPESERELERLVVENLEHPSLWVYLGAANLLVVKKGFVVVDRFFKPLPVSTNDDWTFWVISGAGTQAMRSYTWK